MFCDCVRMQWRNTNSNQSIYINLYFWDLLSASVCNYTCYLTILSFSYLIKNNTKFIKYTFVHARISLSNIRIILYVCHSEDVLKSKKEITKEKKCYVPLLDCSKEKEKNNNFLRRKILLVKW